MQNKILEEIGLTDGEIKVYLALLKLGSTKTGPLASKANVSSSKVYKILDRLEKKGLAGHIIKGKIKFYQGLEPNRLLDYIDEKEKHLLKNRQQVKELLPELENKIKLESLEGEAIVYSGFRSIKNFYLNILDELKSGEEYYVIGATYGENKPGIREFFQNYHMQRARKKIKVKMLANYDIKDIIVKAVQLNSEVKYLPQYLITNMTIVFYKNKSFIFFLTENPTGFLMHNKEAVKSFTSYFDVFWKIAKP